MIKRHRNLARHERNKKSGKQFDDGVLQSKAGMACTASSPLEDKTKKWHKFIPPQRALAMRTVRTPSDDVFVDQKFIGIIAQRKYIQKTPDQRTEYKKKECRKDAFKGNRHQRSKFDAIGLRDTTINAVQVILRACLERTVIS